MTLTDRGGDCTFGPLTDLPGADDTTGEGYTRTELYATHDRSNDRTHGLMAVLVWFDLG